MYCAPIADDTLTFSPDSAHVAYLVGTGSEKNVSWATVLDEKLGKAYERISSITFSPDSKHLVYVAAMHDGANGLVKRVVIDGSEGKPYEDVFTPASLAFDFPDGFHYLAAKSEGIYLVSELIK